MDFAPFQSDDDEEEANFIIEKDKKKKDGTDKKKKKIKIDRKERLSFTDMSPIGSKPKQVVHGVVGPADYIYEQGSPPNEVNQKLAHKNSVPAATAPQASVYQRSVSHMNNYQSPSQTFKTQQFNASPMFHTRFDTPVTTMSSKIERPHSSAAITQERVVPNTPNPFKQQPHYQMSSTTPKKITLLERVQNQLPTASSSSGQQQASVKTHQRNQSYGKAMTAQVVSSQDEVNQVQSALYDKQPLRLQSPVPGSPVPSQDAVSVSPTQSSAGDTNIAKKSEGIKARKISQNMNITERKQSNDEDWARFSVHSSHGESNSELSNCVPPDEFQASAGNMTGSLSDSIRGSTSSLESEVEDTVWKINDEQRDYYTNQFKTLQPNVMDIIKGAQARDFFLKSNLPNEILSRIWRLSDLDNDHALNLEEFCIAMHLVVAVRHGHDLPQELPPTLLPTDEATTEIIHDTDEVFQEHSSEQDDDIKSNEEWSADFYSTQQERTTVSAPSKTDVIQTFGQPTHATSSLVEQRVHPISGQQEKVNREREPNLQHSSELLSKLSEKAPSSPKNRHASVTGGNDAAIARPRAQPTKNVNLMDASPWQLLPPPSSKPKLNARKSLDNQLVESKVPVKSNSHDSVVDTLVSIEKQNDEDLATPINKETINADRLVVRTVTVQKNLSKEKSRSIDSLRSDISESSEFHWRRTNKLDPRARSLTQDSLTEIQPSEKEFEIPPTPPPRPKGHTRASSLDMNQLFNAQKNSNSSPELHLQSKESSKVLPGYRPQKPPRQSIKAKNNVPFVESRSSLTSGLLNSQRKAFSDASLQEPSREEQSGRSSSTSAQKERHVTKESLVRFSDQLQYMNQGKSPIEIQMRKNELQEQISNLKKKRLTLTELNKELESQLVEVSKERIQLKTQLANTPQS